MDATYKTSKYALPLFQLCVSTNVGYSVVATFVVESESIPHIQEALSIIQQWNKDWSPEYFLVDFDTKEIGAIANIFPSMYLFFCLEVFLYLNITHLIAFILYTHMPKYLKNTFPRFFSGKKLFITVILSIFILRIILNL